MARVGERVEAGKAWFGTARGTVPAVDATAQAYEKDRKVVGQLLACAVAYRLFLWLLPLALLVAAVVGFFAAEADRLADSAGLGAFVVNTVGEAASDASRSRWILLGLSLVALYSASSGGAKTLRAVFSSVWGIAPVRPRHAWQPPLAFAAIMLSIATIAGGANWARGRGIGAELPVRLVLFVALGLTALLAALVLPHPIGVTARRLVPGAILLAVGAQVLHVLTVFYLSPKLRNSSELYGGLGAAATVLLWLYLIGRLVVLSAVLNATLWERQPDPTLTHPKITRVGDVPERAAS